jgi:hypothetical protein
MDNNQLDFRDLLLESIADVREIVRDVMIDMTAPMMDMELKKMWAQMPQELKDKLAAERPEEYKALMDHIQNKGERYG